MPVLTFGTTTSDRVDIAAATSIDNLDPFTVMLWVYPTTLTNGRRFWAKGPSAAKRFAINGTLGNIQFQVGRTGAGELSYITNDTPIAAGVWSFVAATFNTANGAGEVANIYTGDLTTLAAESTYGTANDSSGAPDDDSSLGMTFGNRVAGDSAFQGSIAFGGVWNRELTLEEIQEQQFYPAPTTGCVVFEYFGFNGLGTQADFSGNNNHGTPNSSVLSTNTEIPTGIPRWNLGSLGVGT